jgi:hypothetical protein
LPAFLGSTFLVAIGVWLHEKKGETQAARALVASGIASLYLTVVAATQVYHLIDPAFAFVIAGLVAAVSTVIAVRWDSRLVAGLGIGGALLSPVLVDAGPRVRIAFMGTQWLPGWVLVWRSGTWLGVMTFVLTVPQLGEWIADEHTSQLGLTLGVLVLFWALYLVAAAGFEMRVPTARLRVGAGLLTALDAIIVTAVGWAVLVHGWAAPLSGCSVRGGPYDRLGSRLTTKVTRLRRHRDPPPGWSTRRLGSLMDGTGWSPPGPPKRSSSAVARARLDWRVATASSTSGCRHHGRFDARWAHRERYTVPPRRSWPSFTWPPRSASPCCCR